MKNLLQSTDMIYEMILYDGMKELDADDLIDLDMRLRYDRMFPDGEIADIRELYCEMEKMPVLLLKDTYNDVNVAFFYIEDAPESWGRSCFLSFELLREEYKLKRGCYECVVAGLLEYLLDNSGHLCYDDIYGITPYDDIVKFARHLGYDVVRDNFRGDKYLLKYMR